MKTWKVTAELNMDASNYKTIEVKANTPRKAEIIAKEKFKKSGAFYVAITSVVDKDNT